MSELWRGRRGTEWATAGHAADEAFVLLEPAATLLLPAGRAVAGVRAMAAGIGDAPPYPVAVLAQAGAAVAPLSPVGLTATLSPDGDTSIAWVRRSREGWRWLDGIDAPLGEERERYRVTRTVGDTVTVQECAGPPLIYAAAARAADRAAGATVATFAVAQIGSQAVSRPVAITLTL